MKILIAGDITFLGFEAAVLLKAAGHEVVLFGQASRFELNRLKQAAVGEVVLSDTDSGYAVRTLLSSTKPDVVFLNVPPVAADGAGCSSSLLTACFFAEGFRTFKPSLVVLRSSYEVYTPPVRLLHINEDYDTRPGSIRGGVYLATENLLRPLLVRAGIPLTVLRFSELYGFEAVPTGLVQTAVASLVAGRSVGVFNGQDRLDFLHVADAAVATASVIMGTTFADVTAVNVGSGEVVRVGPAVREIATKVGALNRVFFRPPKTPASYRLDLSRILSIYTPVHSLRGSIDEMILAYRGLNV